MRASSVQSALASSSAEALPRLGAAQHRQRIDDAEQGGDGLLRIDLNDLAQDAQAVR